MSGRYSFWRGVAISLLLVVPILLSACNAHVRGGSRPIPTPQPRLALVPDLEGLPLQEARQRLDYAGFRLGRVEERPTKRLQDGTILDQRPAGRAAATLGSEVDVLVAVRRHGPPPQARPRLIEVPDLRGRSRHWARISLSHLGLRIGRVTEIETKVESDGDVIEHFPGFGIGLRRGESVDLIVARAPAPRAQGVAVPDLIGRDVEEAESFLGWAGLRLGAIREKDSDDHAEGMVMKQDPATPERLEPGQRVDIVIARAPEEAPHWTRIPDLSGLNLRQAKRALRKAELQLGTVREKPVKGVPEGRVAKQKPAPWSRVAAGERVNIVIARQRDEAPGGTAVPGLTGLSFEKAVRVLSRAGLRLGRVTDEASEHESPGTVIGQAPRPGVHVEPDVGIDIVMARAPEWSDPKVEVPDLLGMDVAAAKRALRRAGLNLGKVLRGEDRGGYGRGTVIAQMPRPESRTGPGEEVDLVVAGARDDDNDDNDEND